MLILGLDISTSCTGWCILDVDENLVKMGAIPLTKASCPFEKANIVKRELHTLSQEHAISQIFVEQNLQSFRSGFSSAKTLMSLARFNGIVSYLSFDCFSEKPKFINVNSARKEAGLKIDFKDKSKTTKEKVLEWVSSNIDFEWPKKSLKSGPRKGQVVLEPASYDMADAYVIAKAGCIYVKRCENLT